VTVPIKAGKRKKLILIGGAVLLVLLLAGRGDRALAEEPRRPCGRGCRRRGSHGAAEGRASRPGASADLLPLDIFVVNLADRDADRYAQSASRSRSTTRPSPSR
jgi:flagellar FliL protein